MSNQYFLGLLGIAALGFTSACSHVTRLNDESAKVASATAEFSIATVQYPMEGNHTVETFLTKFEAYVRDAKDSGAGLVVFPELLSLDAWPLESKASEKEIVTTIADSITPRLFQAAQRLSKELSIAILAGSSPRKVGKKIYNTALLAFPDGRKVMHDKVFLTAWERKMGWKAGSRIEMFDAPWGRSTILICYDIEFPVVAQALARAKPEVIFVPSMTESRAGLQRVRWTAQARAVELHAYVIVTGTVGKISEGWEHFGQNLFLSPRDKLFPASPEAGEDGKPGTVFFSMNFARLRESKAKTQFYPARDQKRRTLLVVETPGM